MPLAQSPPVGGVTLMVRAGGDPMRLAGPVRDAVRALDPDLAVWPRRWPSVVYRAYTSTEGDAMRPDRSQRARPSRRTDLSIALAAAAAGVYLFGGWLTPVRFVAEEIEVKIDGQTIDVEGIYLYRNHAPWPALLTLGIPFPIDADHPAPFALALDEVDGTDRAIRRLTPAVRGEDVSLRLTFAAWQERRLRLRYSQLARTPRGRYLLTTTRAWRRPVEQAKLTLSLSPGHTLSASSYRLSPLGTQAGWERLGFERTLFWPDRDWDFSWNPKELKRWKDPRRPRRVL